MNGKIGIIAFSFGLTRDEMERKFPNQCNKALGRISRLYYRLYHLAYKTNCAPILILQWEIALDDEFKKEGIIPDLIITEHRQKGEYLDSDEIIAQAIPLLKQKGVTKVISLAQWLQNFKCRALLRKAGFQVLRVKIIKIGFCKNSLQKWTRGPIQLVLYTIKQILFGHRGR